MMWLMVICPPGLDSKKKEVALSETDAGFLIEHGLVQRPVNRRRGLISGIYPTKIPGNVAMVICDDRAPFVPLVEVHLSIDSETKFLELFRSARQLALNGGPTIDDETFLIAGASQLR